jgi:hypothetical protein
MANSQKRLLANGVSQANIHISQLTHTKIKESYG